jgi:hypothetical protein
MPLKVPKCYSDKIFKHHQFVCKILDLHLVLQIKQFYRLYIVLTITSIKTLSGIIRYNLFGKNLRIIFFSNAQKNLN